MWSIINLIFVSLWKFVNNMMHVHFPQRAHSLVFRGLSIHRIILIHTADPIKFILLVIHELRIFECRRKWSHFIVFLHVIWSQTMESWKKNILITQFHRLCFVGKHWLYKRTVQLSHHSCTKRDTGELNVLRQTIFSWKFRFFSQKCLKMCPSLASQWAENWASC